MVAPHETGDLVRSLVRVPGSGYNRLAGSECLDLARASSLAASIPVPKTLPPALATPRATVIEREKVLKEKLGSQDGINAGILQSEIRKRSLSQVSNDIACSNTVSDSSPRDPPAPKRARVVYMTREQILSHANRVIPVNTPNGPILMLQPQSSSVSSNPVPSNPAQIQTQTPTQSQPQPSGSASLSKLIEERNSLRMENQNLQKKLQLFQQLFKDKKRLKSVVERLGVDVS